MKIVCISDTHQAHDKLTIPEGDVLVHCGDATFTGEFRRVLDFANWMKELPHKHKVFVPGNHDFLFQTEPQIAREIMKERGITLLIDEEAMIDGLRFYGSPWTLKFMNWAFMRSEESIADIYRGMPSRIDVLVTHGPPMGIRDRMLGSESLLKAVHWVRPKLHAFGHIHACYGREHHGYTEFVNCAVMNEAYEVMNEPISVEIS